MASYYTIAGSSPGVRVLSQVEVLDVQAVAIYTKPSNVRLVVQVPKYAWDAGDDNTYLEPPALLTEQMMGNDTGSGTTGGTYVNAVRWVQDQDISGLLAGFIEVTVYYQPSPGFSLPLTAIVRLPMTSIESFAAFTQPLPGGTPSELIQAAYNRLVATAGL